MPPSKHRTAGFGIAEVAQHGTRYVAWLPEGTPPAAVAAFEAAYRQLCEQHGLRELNTSHFISKTA